jgi:serine/threonine-protein kinase
MELIPGAMLTDNLRLERELGHGAMGAVWIATNVALGSRVAVKVMKAHGSEEYLRRFQREARGLAQIDSPHVVRIFDLGVKDHEPFIVMELLEGEDLRERIERTGPLPLPEVSLVTRHLCRALAAAHERNIVHRDIKPANLFLTSAAGETFVKVLDFGVAKFLGPDLGMTSTGAFMGTPYYASPEQLVDPKKIDHRSDLWSVAVVAYAALTGQLPFVAETIGALSIAIHKGEYEPPCAVRPELPPAVDGWMRRALSLDPDHRFPDAMALSSALDEALAGRQVVDAALPQTVAMPQQVSVQAMPGATVPGAPLAQSTLSPTSAPAETQTSMAPTQRMRRRSPWPMVLGIFGALAVVAGGGYLVLGSSLDGAKTGATGPANTSAPEPAPSDEPSTTPTGERMAPAPEPPAPTASPEPSETAPPEQSSTPAAQPPTWRPPPSPPPQPPPPPSPPPQPTSNNPFPKGSRH